MARDGAKVRFSPAAIASAEAGEGLLAEGSAEGLAIYGTNRGPGALREVPDDLGRDRRPLTPAQAAAPASAPCPRSTRRSWSGPSW